MSNNIVYGSIYGNNLTKEQRKPVPDKDGWYTMCVGALNKLTETHQNYLGTEEVIALFNSSSELQRKLKRGYLKGELKHPEFKRGMTSWDYIDRLNKIDYSNVAIFIKKIWLVPTNKTEDGKNNVMFIYAKVKGGGPHEQWVTKAFADPDVNLALSIRCKLKKNVSNPYTNKKIIERIVTFDLVDEPGYKCANQWKDFGLEHLNSGLDLEEHVSIDIAELAKYEDIIKQKTVNMVGLEDNSDYSSLLDDINEFKKENNSNFMSVWK